MCVDQLNGVRWLMKLIGCSGRTTSPGYPLYLNRPNLATMMMVVVMVVMMFSNWGSLILPGVEEHGGFKIHLNLP